MTWPGLLSLLLAAPPAGSGQRVAVVCASRSPLCETLEADLENKLASPSVVVIPAAELARSFAVPPDTAVEDAEALAEKALLEKAESDYFRSGYDQAAVEGSADNLVQLAQPLTVGDRPGLLVLRAALAFKHGQHEVALADAKAALELDPRFDAGAFPPAVQGLVEEARKSFPPPIPFTVSTVPPEAEVWVDGRRVTGGQILVHAGKRRLEARAPAYQRIVRDVLVAPEDRDKKAEVRLPVAVPVAFMRAVSAWLEGGARGDKLSSVIRDDARRQGTEAVLKTALKEVGALRDKAQAESLLVLVPEEGRQLRAVLFRRETLLGLPLLGNAPYPIGADGSSPEAVEAVKRFLALPDLDTLSSVRPARRAKPKP